MAKVTDLTTGEVIFSSNLENAYLTQGNTIDYFNSLPGDLVLDNDLSARIADDDIGIVNMASAFAANKSKPSYITISEGALLIYVNSPLSNYTVIGNNIYNSRERIEGKITIGGKVWKRQYFLAALGVPSVAIITKDFNLDSGTFGVRIKQDNINRVSHLFYRIAEYSDWNNGPVDVCLSIDHYPGGQYTLRVSDNQESPIGLGVFAEGDKSAGQVSSTGNGSGILYNTENFMTVINFRQQEDQYLVSGAVKLDGQPLGTQVVITTNDTVPFALTTVVSDPITGYYEFQTPYNKPVMVFTMQDYGLPWSASTAKVIGDVVHPTTPNGYIYKVTKAGNTGQAEPIWTAEQNASINDGSVIYQSERLLKPEIEGYVTPTPIA